MATVGGISDPKGVENSLEIDSLARFAVDEHNKKQNSVLEFGKVISTREQGRCTTSHWKQTMVVRRKLMKPRFG
ncbi:hypothetical protein L1987_45741 [Smallanthus sonchifolius]|uniref:Uncharacterized protein n=1 Tax=Smallanthus sonchifolius TaxID=185202 RepID=A0ACB9FYU0_9ASTR|nr:hypothetical protein L1987_45741 [Smallanthus sonchifolius]